MLATARLTLLNRRSTSVNLNKIFFCKQDRQALLEAKYCPRVAAASCTQETPRNPCDLDLGRFDLEIQQGSRGCRGTCSCKISSS